MNASMRARTVPEHSPNPDTDIAEARTSTPKGPLVCDFVERTTGFEPATLTLAR